MEENKSMESTQSKPGALALAAIEQSDDTVFKKPFPVNAPKKAFQPEVLIEETYLEEIGKIIQRDFFPDLEKLKAQHDYLSAIENNDIEKLQEIYGKYSIGRRVSSSVCSSPATFETPIMRKIESSEDPFQSKTDENEVEEPPSKLRKVKTLDQFLKSYTSEDNESFEEIVIENEKKQRSKYPWLYKDENAIQGSTLALPSTEEQYKIEDSKPSNIETWTYKNKNYVMYVPDGVEFSREEKLEMIKKKKEINYSGTRLRDCPFDEEQNKETIQTLAQTQARSYDGKVGIDGKELSVNDCYDLLKTPSPMPGVNESPLMTWGEIDGTPFRLDGSDTPIRPGLPGPVFKIAEPPVRERLAHSLAEKVSEKNRDSKKKARENAKKQLAMSSPMSARLFDSFDAASPSSTRSATDYLMSRINPDSSLKSLYSPRTPLLSPKLLYKSKSTPSRSPSVTPTRTYNTDFTLTDNLLNLNIPKRPKAADYFS